MDAAEPEIVDWPSLLLALLVDSLVVWAPTFLVFSWEGPAAVALVLPLAGLAANWMLFSNGSTLGGWLCGFRMRTRYQTKPGAIKGLILALMTAFSIPAVVLLIAINYPGGAESGPLGNPAGYPLLGERTGRRRLLEAADAYWERWS
jgi:hypothetical protein